MERRDSLTEENAKLEASCRVRGGVIDIDSLGRGFASSDYSIIGLQMSLGLPGLQRFRRPSRALMGLF